MTVTIRTKKRRMNYCLSRKQMIIDVFHQGLFYLQGKPNISKQQLKGLVAKKLKADQKNIVLFGFKTLFGGGKSTGFCLIYDNPQYLLKYEPNYRLRRLKILEAKAPSRKAQKQLKKKIKKTRAGERRKIQAQRKKKTNQYWQKAKLNYLKNLAL